MLTQGMPPLPKAGTGFLKGTRATWQDVPTTGGKCPASRVSGGREEGAGQMDDVSPSGRPPLQWERRGRGGCSPLLIVARRLVPASPSSGPLPISTEIRKLGHPFSPTVAHQITSKDPFRVGRGVALASPRPPPHASSLEPPARRVSLGGGLHQSLAPINPLPPPTTKSR